MIPETVVPKDVDELQRQLDEALETLAAIRNGEVDAFLINGPDGERVYTLETADRPYRVMVECMQQGALIVDADGNVLFANSRFSDMLDVPHERLVGASLESFLQPE